MTPTEDLCLEVLAARHRLGEIWWTFDTRHHAALKRLESRGLVSVMHGIIEKTIRARLTDAGRDETLSTSYVPPIHRGS